MATLKVKQSTANAGKDSAVWTLAKIANQLAGFLNDDGVLVAPQMAINGGTAQQFDLTTTGVITLTKVNYAKAPEAALTFTANHLVTASRYGSVLVQQTAAGVVSTLITGLTQTTTQAYTTAALAIAAVPAPAASNVAIGYMVIAAGVGGFTANTTALTGITTFYTYQKSLPDDIEFRETGKPE